VSLASSGASRKHVAAIAGCPYTTLVGWVERGLAFPDEEPWGSFSLDYQRAEAGIAGAAADIRGATIQIMREQVAEHLRWRASGVGGLPPPLPTVNELVWMDRAMEARFPAHYGSSKHRTPDADFDGANFTNATALTHEQLCAVISDPPEPIRKAIVARAADVYALLLAHGFDPARKATDETE
jgi:hypothetical protein